MICDSTRRLKLRKAGYKFTKTVIHKRRHIAMFKEKIKGACLIFTVFIFCSLTAHTACSAQPLEDIRSAIKEKGARWHADQTSIFQLADHEKKIRMGLKKPTSVNNERMLPSAVSAATGSTTGSSTGTATSLNWKTLGYVTSIKDQGSCGGCWAFAATAALESYILIKDGALNTEDNRAEEILLSCSSAGNCNGGYIDDASDYIKKTGLPPETYFAFTAASTDDKCSNAKTGWTSNTRKINSWYYVATTSPSVSAIKTALTAYGPLVTTMAVYYDFYSYKSGVYEYTTGALQGYHAILIVGFQDDTSVNGGGYFIVKNSWGTDWGEAGYFKIAYNQLTSKAEFGEYTIAYIASGQSIAAPSGLKATAISGSSIKLAWTDNSSNETGFKIERCKGSGCSSFSQIAVVNAGVGTYTDSGLAANTSYTYQVRAYNGQGNSDYSEKATATTTANATVPEAPTNLKATANSATSILLSWADNSGNETGFKVERCIGSGCTDYVQIGTVSASGASTLSVMNSGLQKGTTYGYRVRSYNAAGNSAYSNTASAKTLTNANAVAHNP